MWRGSFGSGVGAGGGAGAGEGATVEAIATGTGRARGRTGFVRGAAPAASTLGGLEAVAVGGSDGGSSFTGGGSGTEALALAATMDATARGTSARRTLRTSTAAAPTTAQTPSTAATIHGPALRRGTCACVPPQASAPGLTLGASTTPG